MDAIELLKAQHEEVEDLFARIERDEDDDKEELFQMLADNLAAHTTIEEKLFYPAAYAASTSEMLREAVEEHLAIKRVIADLLEMTPDDENFDAKLKVLREQVEHHVDEEDRDLFPACAATLGSAQLEALGTEMKALFDDEMAKGPSESVLDQTTEAAPLR
jgi:hemerythrin-like domain-containing protein